jgi:hypothetical protein
MDHGIESAEDRRSVGKPEQGRLLLRSIATATEFTISIEDDGRGISWEAVARRAQERGLAHACREDLLLALMDDGLSTAVEVTDVSGRGVGMSAVLSTTQSLGGRIVVASSDGEGTRFDFVVPRPGNDFIADGSMRPAVRPSLVPSAAPRFARNRDDSMRALAAAVDPGEDVERAVLARQA